jgi:solute carrier family 6 amino acid transporter-like protein 5/7/9/14
LIFNEALHICPCFHIYSKYVLNEPDSIEDGIGVPGWRLTLCLLFSWITVYLVIIRGVKSSGKAAYFLALFPYVIMFALLIRGVTLPGAGEGVLYFITPQWEELANPQVSGFKESCCYVDAG